MTRLKTRWKVFCSSRLRRSAAFSFDMALKLCIHLWNEGESRPGLLLRKKIHNSHPQHVDRHSCTRSKTTKFATGDVSEHASGHKHETHTRP